MKFLINGKSAPSDVVLVHKAADGLDIPVRIFNDDGSPIDLATGTLTLEVYDLISRKNSATKSYGTTTVVAAAGAAKVVPTVAANTCGPGTYYAFAKFVVTSGGAVNISTNYVTLKAG